MSEYIFRVYIYHCSVECESHNELQATMYVTFPRQYPVMMSNQQHHGKMEKWKSEYPICEC